MIWRMAAMVPVGLIGGALGFWMIDDEPPVVATAPAEVMTDFPPPGGTLLIRFHVFRKRSCPVRVERLIYDSSNVRYDLSSTAFEAVQPLGFEIFQTKIPLPASMAQGPARYRSVSTYTCNLLHYLWPIRGPGQDLKFVVVGEPVHGDSPAQTIP